MENMNFNVNVHASSNLFVSIEMIFDFVKINTH